MNSSETSNSEVNEEANNSREEMTVTNDKHFAERMIVHLMIGLKEICIITAAIPLVTLFCCFVTAYIFQAEEVHETHCRVYNVIPSISAITGVSPQRYFWRISIALHIGPRFIIAAVYRSYYLSLLDNITDSKIAQKAHRLITLVYWLHFIEISALCGVTYVSNRENYPMHEKIFITFMTCSLCHMLATIKLNKIIHPNGPQTEDERKSLEYKKILFGVSIASTIGLILFFLKHRFLCHDLAFSWFALCEYIIASANMAFHCTTMLDFPSEHFLIAKGATIFKTKRIVHVKVD